MPLIEGQPLRILHATRAPVGGIIRHILDLANGQAERGHHVGIIADSLTGGDRADQALAVIAPRMKLGVHRIAIRREPSVAVEVESYRPFFILGEVQAPGQYPYVPNMTAESAVAIAGGFSPRARKDRVTITHTDASGTSRAVMPPGTPISPGDTVLVGERWF